MKGLTDKTSRNVFFLSAVAVLLVLAGAVLLIQGQLDRLFQHRRWVIHTQEVLMRLANLDAAWWKSESAQQVFLITGKPAHLNAYAQAKKNVKNELAFIKSLVPDNQAQAQRVAELDAAVDAKFEDMQQMIDERTSGGIASTQKDILDEKGNDQDTRVHQVLDAMKKTENGLLAQRTKALELTAEESVNRMIILTLIAGAGFLLVMRRLASIESSRSRMRYTQESLFEISKILSEPQALTLSMSSILESLCRRFGFATGCFFEEGENEALRCAEFYSTCDVSEFEKATRALEFTKGEGLPGRVWEARIPLWIADVTTDPGFKRKKEAIVANLHAGIGFPIFVEDKFTGLFEFYSREIEKADKDLLDAFAVVGVEIGQLIERRRVDSRLQDSLAELAHAKATMASCLESMGSGVVVADLDGKFILFNNSAQRILGLGAVDQSPDLWSETYGLYSDEGKTPSKRDELPLVRAINGESVDDIELYCKHEGHQKGVWISVNGRPIRNAAGDVTGGVVVIEDVSLRKEGENRVSQFYATVSHELRTPLTSIKGALGLLEAGKAGELSQRAKHLVTMGRQECDRLVRLINDILDLRKVEAGRFELTLERIAPNDVVSDTLAALTSFAQEHEVTLEAFGHSLEMVEADRDRVIQVLTNLVSNAVKFSPRGTSVKVRSETIGSAVRFSIIDTGPGISETNQKRLFQLFSQVDSSDSRPKGGTGLGLAVSKALVEEHGGTIGLISAEGKGSTFWFELPIVSPIITAQAGRTSLVPGRLRVSGMNASLSNSNVSGERPSLAARGKVSGEREPLASTGKVSGEHDPLVSTGKVSGERDPAKDKLRDKLRDRLSITTQNKVTVKDLSLDVTNKATVDATQSSDDEILKDATRRRILVVEDDNAVADLITEILILDNMTVARAADLFEARALLEEIIPAAIIIDPGLPDGSGLDLISDPVVVENEIPVVVLTANRDAPIFAPPVVIDWITKPFEQNRLSRAVHLAVQKRESGRAIVLVVDDDAAMRDIICQQLEVFEVDCVVASTGAQAIELAKSCHPDLVILDVVLPEGDGFDFVAALKEDEVLSSVPVVVYTVQDLNEEDRERLKLGLTDYLTKAQTDEKDFLASVRNLLNGLIEEPIDAKSSGPRDSGSPKPSDSGSPKPSDSESPEPGDSESSEPNQTQS